MSTSSGPRIHGFLGEGEVCNSCMGCAPLQIGEGSLVGIFGGQVISQAIVAATKTVDRVSHLHVSGTPFISEPVVSTLTFINSLCTYAPSAVLLSLSSSTSRNSAILC